MLSRPVSLYPSYDPDSTTVLQALQHLQTQAEVSCTLVCIGFLDHDRLAMQSYVLGSLNKCPVTVTHVKTLAS